MGRWSRTFKKYERHFLLGLVVILLLTFSVTGAVQCSQGGDGEGQDLGGSFQLPIADQQTVTNAEFVEQSRRAMRFREAVCIPARIPEITFRFAFPYLMAAQPQGAPTATWQHILLTEAARAAGYHCGDDYQLKTAVQEAVQNSTAGFQYSDELYARFLRQRWGGSAADFQDAVREVVIRDQFLRPLIDTFRYSYAYPEAYEKWKEEHERVNLAYVAASGEDFRLPVLEQEVTRTTIGEQEGRLRDVGDTVGRIRRVVSQAESYKARHDAYPTTFEEIPDPFEQGTPKDAWGTDLRYAVENEAPWPVSAGPDGEFDTGDDLTPDTVKQVDTLAALREVGDALLQWYVAEEAWPEAIEDLRASPPSGGLPPLKTPGRDGWAQELGYEKGEGEAPPRLFSLGPDGAPGTDDDVAAVISADRAVVPVSPALAIYVDGAARDAWDHALRFQLKQAMGTIWEVASAGKDGEWFTDDDVTESNANEIQNFYNRPEIRADYVTEVRRRFQALYAHLPLIPDAVLERMWEAFPDAHPDEEDAYDYWWRNQGESYYLAENPADPETGHGAELALRLAPAAQHVLVPRADIFGEVPSAFAVPADEPDGSGRGDEGDDTDRGEGDEGDEEGEGDEGDEADDTDPGAGDEGDEGDEEEPGADLPEEPVDPLRRVYVEKGWRPILLRELFVDRVLNDLLAEARDSRDAHEAWKERKAAYEAWQAAQPEDGDGDEEE
ncbi:MAG: hypothetical protein ACYTG6_15765, partial [Planctomycetota bacterium]